MAKILEGKVVSTKMDKTAVVLVERKFRHADYKKVIVRHKKYKAHLNDDVKVVEGQVVKIKEVKPISKDKHFIVMSDKEKSKVEVQKS